MLRTGSSGKYFSFILFWAAIGCGKKAQSPAAAPPWLSQQQYMRLVKAGDFLASLQQADGAILAAGKKPGDSRIAQTGYALQALIELNRWVGKYNEVIRKGRAFLASHAEANHLWKYKLFLPPDLDDTTAAFAALQGGDAENRRLSAKCAAAVLSFQEKSGALRTWLADEAAMRAIGLDAKAFRITEVHPEVMAYFFDSLAASGLNGFSKQSEDAALFLVKTQKRDGRWKTVWYRSDLYAVYRIHRYLTRQEYAAQYHTQLRAAENFVRVARLSNGAWGIDGKPSNLDTAFALSVLSVGKTNVIDLERAATYLIQAQAESGAWPAEDFFFLDASQRSSGKKPLFIGSELYSTAIVAESLLQYFRLYSAEKKN